MKTLQTFLILVILCFAQSAYADSASRWVGGNLVFYDDASYESVHAMAPTTLFDDFMYVGSIDTTNDWAFAQVNTGTLTVSTATGGIARLTTGAADDDDAELAGGIIWSAAKHACIEVRLASNDVDASGYAVGFTDAAAEGADTLAVTYATATLTSTASNCALFFNDPDATTDLICCVAVKADTDGTVISTGTAPVDAAYHIYRIELSVDGTVDFWFDGAHIGTQATGITAATLLCPYVGLINREGAANTLDVDYIRVWQNR